MLLVKIFFWMAASWLAYALLLYPLSMGFVGLCRRERDDDSLGVGDKEWPSVAILIAVCNEATVLRDRFEKLREIDYPAGRWQVILITDDGSTDGTIEVARDSAIQPDVRHLHCPHRGKNRCLDFAVAQTDADVLVFKDAAGVFAADALRRLVRHFSDANIGCVGGRASFEDNGQLGASEQVYWRYERLLRRGNEVLGYVPSAAGAIHALRRELYRPVANNITRDMVDPTQAILGGQRGLTDNSAVCFETPWDGVTDVYQNRIRVTKRAWAAILYNAKHLWRCRRFLVLAQLISHKVLRFLLLFPLLVVFLTSIAMAVSSPGWASLATGLSMAQVFIYGGATASLLLAVRGIRLPWLSFLGFLVLSVVAFADGSLRFCYGKRASAWRDSEAVLDGSPTMDESIRELTL